MLWVRSPGPLPFSIVSMVANCPTDAVNALPPILQGGMGIAVSDWYLARAASTHGALGVVSGTALDTVLIRRLQDGDAGGHMRRALSNLPLPGLGQRILDAWFQPDGRDPEQPYRLKPLPGHDMRPAEIELIIAANFVEVFLAKEGHRQPVGLNLLEKISAPNLPSLYGAMLAGVDVVIMGGGIPISIPGVLDALAAGEPAELAIPVAGVASADLPRLRLDPSDHPPLSAKALKRPLFLAVVGSDTLAKTLVRKASGRVDGFVVEHHCAGGHNAPPRQAGAYGPRDSCDLAKMRSLERPFWIAGGAASPAALRSAREAGAQGIQVGTAFACTRESGIDKRLKIESLRRAREGRLESTTDFKASPTGYPFKRVRLDPEDAIPPRSACDLGYLRHCYRDAAGALKYRCPAGPRAGFLAKGGDPDETDGKRCLCNGLLATIGLGQVRDGRQEPPILTWGEAMDFLRELPGDANGLFGVRDLLTYLRSSDPGSGEQ